MRDFRDAKAMARTLRAALAAKGIRIAVSESLELIAAAFGAADWNTLAAAIRRDANRPHDNALMSHVVPASLALAATLRRARTHAATRKHEYITLEHLLLALVDDVDAATIMTACKVDPDALAADVVRYVDGELTTLMTGDGDPRPTAAFQRVVARAQIHVRSTGRDTITGRNLLVAMFAENESPAVWFLGEHGLTREDAANVILPWMKSAEDGS